MSFTPQENTHGNFGYVNHRTLMPNNWPYTLNGIGEITKIELRRIDYSHHILVSVDKTSDSSIENGYEMLRNNWSGRRWTYLWGIFHGEVLGLFAFQDHRDAILFRLSIT
jgi:hypothetical protein